MSNSPNKSDGLGEKVLGKVIPEGELDRLVGSGRGNDRDEDNPPLPSLTLPPLTAHHPPAKALGRVVGASISQTAKPLFIFWSPDHTSVMIYGRSQLVCIVKTNEFSILTPNY